VPGRGTKRPVRHTRVIVTHYGGPDSLRVIEEERPEPKNGEVRVRVLAAGVSLPDIMAREGVHPETPPVPFTPGWDLVGVVDRLGEGRDWLQLVRVVVNAFVEPPSSGCTSPSAGFSRAGNGWPPTASKRSNG